MWTLISWWASVGNGTSTSGSEGMVWALAGIPSIPSFAGSAHVSCCREEKWDSLTHAAAPLLYKHLQLLSGWVGGLFSSNYFSALTTSLIGILCRAGLSASFRKDVGGVALQIVRWMRVLILMNEEVGMERIQQKLEYYLHVHNILVAWISIWKSLLHNIVPQHFLHYTIKHISEYRVSF